MAHLLIIVLAAFIFAVVYSAFLARLMREYQLRTLIGRYPKRIYESARLALPFEQPFAELVNDVLPKKNAMKPYRKKLKKPSILKRWWQQLSKRPLTYDFVCSHYPATLGNLSEVARRKFGSDTGKTKELRQQAFDLYNAIMFSNTDLALRSVANSYRVMLDIEIPASGAFNSTPGVGSTCRQTLGTVESRLEHRDVFAAYIELISKAKTENLSQLNDVELIAYETIKTKLEAFFQSYVYPVEGTFIVDQLDDIKELVHFAVTEPRMDSRTVIEVFS